MKNQLNVLLSLHPVIDLSFEMRSFFDEKESRSHNSINESVFHEYFITVLAIPRSTDSRLTL